MRKFIATLKSLFDWAATAWTVIGWLGGTAWITGIVIAIGGAVWAVVRGVPVPIAIMAGYCTFVGAVVLTLAPLAYRALSRIAAFPVPHDAAAPQKPNATVWQHVPQFSLYQAACLLADVTPAYASWKMEGDVQAWFETLVAEIRAKEMTHIPRSTTRNTPIQTATTQIRKPLSAALSFSALPSGTTFARISCSRIE